MCVDGANGAYCIDRLVNACRKQLQFCSLSRSHLDVLLISKAEENKAWCKEYRFTSGPYFQIQFVVWTSRQCRPIQSTGGAGITVMGLNRSPKCHTFANVSSTFFFLHHPSGFFSLTLFSSKFLQESNSLL